MAALGSIAAAGCGSGSGSSGSPTTAAGSAGGAAAPVAASMSVDDFCSSLDGLNLVAQKVGLDRQLVQVRADLAGSAAKAHDVFAAGVPPHSDGVGQAVGRLTGDLQVISAWVQTKATQADLDADRAPAAVRRAVDDMGFQFRTLQQWAAANCKAQPGGD